MDIQTAYEMIERTVERGGTPGGYLICGDIRGNARQLTMKILRLLFPGEIEQVNHGSHPDVAWLEPEGKSRTIHADSMREKIVEPTSVTSFSGGWKVGVIVGADCMETVAANAFLKSLEEPPPKTLFLLLTDQPDAILPTIISRTQRIDLPAPSGLLEDEYYDQIQEIFESNLVNGVYEKAQVASRLAGIFLEAKGDAEEEEAAIIRKSFFKTLIHFVRQWMIKEKLPRYQVFRNLEAIEEAYQQSCRYLSDEAVIAMMMDRMNV